MGISLGVSARTFTVDEPGGAAQSGMKLVRELPDNTALTLYGHPNVRTKFPNVNVNSTGYILDSLGFGLLWEQSVLPILGDNHDLDVLFCPNSYCPIMKTDYKKIIAIHSLTSYHGYSSGTYAKFRRVALPKAISSADCVIAVSNFLRSEIIKRFDVKEEKLRVVYNGIDPVYHGNKRKSVEALPDKYILYVGALSRNKNVDGVIESYRRLREKYDVDEELVIVGPSTNPTVQTIEMEDLNEDITFTGYISDPHKLKYIYEQASVFLFPSYYESFGLPPLEAMSCGTPVVSSNRGALPEICSDAAIFADPDDTSGIADNLHELLSDREKYKMLAKKGRERASHFTWSAASDRLLNIATELAE